MSVLRRRTPGLIGAVALFAFAIVGSAACDDDADENGVEAIATVSDETPTAHVEDGHATEPGVVETRPADATQIDVSLQEWSVNPAESSVAAGSVYFLVENVGPEHPHEFVIIRTDLAPDALPVEDGRVPEDEVEIVDEIEPFAVGSSASITVDLEAGSYALICNITEEEDGEIESHYELGMYAQFTVE